MPGNGNKEVRDPVYTALVFQNHLEMSLLGALLAPGGRAPQREKRRAFQ